MPAVGVGSRPLPREAAWSPLAVATFRAIWIASVVSNVGTWMQNVGVAWLMTTLTPSPVLVALIQTATSLPVLLVGLPAGALADLVDRRRLLLVCQTWMLVAAAVLSGLTFADRATPAALLLLTFALGLGGSINSPAWQAIVAEVVPPRQLANAVALNGAGFNLARAIGPAFGGLVVAAAGPGWVFLLNAVSFLATIVVLYRWRRVPRPSTSHAERLVEALFAGLRYVRFAPAVRAMLARSVIFVLCASAMWALLPLVARQQLGLDSSGYGLLLACLGIGAVLGAFVLPRLRHTFSIDHLIVGASVVFALGTAALGWLGVLPLLGLALAASGAAWLTIMSSFNVAAQTVAPTWVSARVLGTYLLVSQGGLAAGSFAWGAVADRLGLPAALALAAGGLVLGLAVTPLWRLAQGERLDLRPSAHMADPPTELGELEPRRGPVLVIAEYRVPPERAAEFRQAMQAVRIVRRRDGAVRWALYEDPTDLQRYMETFVVPSLAEHLRQHERATISDRAVEERVWQLAEGPPEVRHLVAAEA
jgi:MFS family permease/quinol monooxygenase YgiN